MAEVDALPWRDDGYTLTRGSASFGGWTVAQVGELTPEGIEVQPPEFMGDMSGQGFGNSSVMVVGVDAARTFALDLLAAVDHAERLGMR